MLKKKFRMIGNSWGILIPKSVIEVAKISPNTDEVGITVENGKIVIEKYKKKD